MKLLRDEEGKYRVNVIEQNKTHCLPVIAHLLETITDEQSALKSYVIAYCTELLRTAYYFEEISAIIDSTTFSSKQLSASKNTHCEVNKALSPAKTGSGTHCSF